MGPPRIHVWSSLLLTFILLKESTSIWPFPTKRFTANAFIDAGNLGLEDAGRVVAFGDIDGNQFLDVITVNEDQTLMTVFLWDHDKFQFTKNITLQSAERIVNVIPGDFTHDGKLDLLVMSALSGGSDRLEMVLHVGAVPIGFEQEVVETSPSTMAQPIPLDFNGNMRIDLLGQLQNDGGAFKVWKNVWETTNHSTLFELIDAGLDGPTCQMANPHSNAILDFDGDCLADIFLLCTDPKSSTKTFQIWLNDKNGGFKFHSSDTLPPGSGPVTFADMDRDGTIDMVFPTCETTSSNGVGRGCSINIAYNIQRPLCSSSSSTGKSQENCRRPDELCTPDPGFKFDLRDSVDNKAFIRIPLNDIVHDTSKLLVSDTSFHPELPQPLKLGDANLDGFPDILLITVQDNETEHFPRLIWSVPCAAHIPGCSVIHKNGQRGFKLADSKDTAVLGTFKDVRSVSFLDLDEDGTLDILVQRTGSQGQGKVNFVQNNIFRDAFFMKAIVLNGACGSVCTPNNASELSYHPFGVSYPGATYKYTILDTSGRRSAAQISQLPQTSYHSLLTPYSFFGLGRTNNYIENLFVGSTKKFDTDSHNELASNREVNWINMEGVIPNSRVVIIPPDGSGSEWKRELYLRPGEWIPWVTVTLVVATLLLGAIVGAFHWNEKREDELEKRRAVHHINFDAL